MFEHVTGSGDLGGRGTLLARVVRRLRALLLVGALAFMLPPEAAARASTPTAPTTTTATTTLTTLTTVAAMATESPVPTDIARVFARDALPFVTTTLGGGAALTAEESALRAVDAIGRIHQLHTWSAAALEGRADADPCAAATVWAGVLLARGTPVGTVRVGRTQGRAEPSGFDTDAAQARALQGVTDGRVVDDAPIGAYFLIAGGRVSALGGTASTYAPTAQSLESFLPGVASRAMARRNASSWDGTSGPIGTTAGWLGGLTAAMALAAAAIAITRLRKAQAG